MFAPHVLAKSAAPSAQARLHQKTMEALLQEIGVDRFKALGPRERYRPHDPALLAMDPGFTGGRTLRQKLRVVEKLPPDRREKAKIRLLAGTALGRSLLHATRTQLYDYGPQLSTLQWMGIERFQRLAETSDYDLSLLHGGDREGFLRHNARWKLETVRKSRLPVEEQYRAATEIIKRTTFGKQVLITGRIPPMPSQTTEDGILEAIGGEGRFLELVQQQPPFDFMALPLRSHDNCSFDLWVSRIQKLSLGADEEEKAYVELLARWPTGKRLMRKAGLPLRPPFPRGRTYNSRCSDLALSFVARIGHKRFVELSDKPMFDLDSIPGYSESPKRIAGRCRIIKNARLPKADEERALVALLLPSMVRFYPDPSVRQHLERIYRAGRPTKTQAAFDTALEQIGPRRFLELAGGPPLDLKSLGVEPHLPNLPCRLTAIRKADLSAADREMAIASALARSTQGKAFIAEAKAKAAEETAAALPGDAAGSEAAKAKTSVAKKVRKAPTAQATSASPTPDSTASSSSAGPASASPEPPGTSAKAEGHDSASSAGPASASPEPPGTSAKAEGHDSATPDDVDSGDTAAAAPGPGVISFGPGAPSAPSYSGAEAATAVTKFSVSRGLAGYRACDAGVHALAAQTRPHWLIGAAAAVAALLQAAGPGFGL